MFCQNKKVAHEPLGEFAINGSEQKRAFFDKNECERHHVCVCPLRLSSVLHRSKIRTNETAIIYLTDYLCESLCLTYSNTEFLYIFIKYKLSIILT